MSEDQAERLYSKLFLNLLQSDADVRTIRRVAELGQPAAAATLSVDNYRFALSIQSDPAYDAYFIDRKRAVEFLGGPKAMGTTTTMTQLGQFAKAIDAASLIFVHSAVDAALSDLCRVTLLFAPAEWEQFVGNQRTSISDLRSQGVEELVRAKLEAHVEALERESLPKRADRLFAVCKPAAGFDPIGNYLFDRARLVAIDDERHRVTHGSRTTQALVDCEQKLEFLIKTGLFFAAMVNERFGVKINPMYALGLELPDAAPPPTAPVDPSGSGGSAT